MNLTQEKRFWSYVKKTDSCWLWTGGKSGKGYGGCYWNGRRWRANRVAWLIFKGPIPKGLNVCHACDNRKCVRPDHLFLGSHADNVRDRDRKGRQAIGSRNGAAKLSEADVVHIRAARRKGVLVKTLVQQYGIGITTMEAILYGQTWRHVGEGGKV